MSDQSPASMHPRSFNLRRMVASIPGARSTWHLGRSLRDMWLDSSEYSQIKLRREFAQTDPWRYSNDELQLVRRNGELAMLDRVRGIHRFSRALELGCAEGIFTEYLADRCDSLLAAEFNEVALGRARERCQRAAQVQFASFDLRAEPIPGVFDIILAIHILEYIQNPIRLRRIRKKIIAAMKPGGYLLLGCVSFKSPNEDAWWSQYLLRGGKQINSFFAQHPKLTLVDSAIHPLGDCDSLDILLRKVQ